MKKYIYLAFGVLYGYAGYFMCQEITKKDETLNFIGSAVTYPLDTLAFGKRQLFC